MMLLLSRRSQVLVAILTVQTVEAYFYVSYESPHAYTVGDWIPLVANKLTSASTLSSIQYNKFPLCNAPGVAANDTDHSWWNQGLDALHGEDLIDVSATFPIMVGADTFCTTLCEVDNAQRFQPVIQQGFHYNWFLGDLPIAVRLENDETVSTQYWGGVPIGRMGGNNDNLEPRFEGTSSNDAFFYNHYKLKVFFHKLEETKIQIIRTVVEPYSVNYNDPDSLTLQCGDPDRSGMFHLSYDRLENVTAQLATGVLRMTYDIQWVETQKPFKTRWNVYLSMNDAVPGWIELLNCMLGGLILCFLGGSLYTWVMRDLSYKPVIELVEVSEKEAEEIQMWPFSTRIFFPPVQASLVLCILCGIGAHLLMAGFFFVFFFRFGIINAAQGKTMITSGLIIYCLCGIVGGYVTGRLYSIFHGERIVALAASLVTAVGYPLLGMFIVVLVYDVLPGVDAPRYNVIGNITPLVLAWMFTAWPLTVGGAYFGHRHGPIHHFPVSSGSQGYQDLNLQDNDNREQEEELIEGWWFVFVRKWRITIAFLFGGLLPVFSSFISYSYSIAAPVLIGSYPVRSYMVTSFLLFNMVAATGAVLAYYRQIRAHMFHWWWSTFAAASSAGLYIFFLSLSYMIAKADSNIQFRTLFGYILWFGFVSLGVGMMTGFSGIALCILFNRVMYSMLMHRNESL